MAHSSSQNNLKTLFSQNDPQLYFHKSPAVNKKLPNLNRDHEVSRPIAVTDTVFSAVKEVEEEGRSHKKHGIQSMTSEQVKHKLYV